MRCRGSLFLALLMGMAGVEGGVGQAAEPRGVRERVRRGGAPSLEEH